MEVVGAEIVARWNPLILLIALAGLRTEGRKAFVLVILAGAPLLYWVAMARIAACEPMLNALLLAPLLAVGFALGVRQLPRALIAPVLVFATWHVIDHRLEWQTTVYNIYRKEGYEATQILLELTRPGDTIFEDGDEIGPGRLMYYAWDRKVVRVLGPVTPCEYIKPRLRSSAFLVTTKDPSVFAGLSLREVKVFSAWHIYAIAVD
jgi:hypothetical protein